METKDCIKGFNQVVGKAIPPKQTCNIVLRKIRNMKDPILKGYFKVPQQISNVSRYKVFGTDYFREIAQVEGTNGKGHCDEQALASGIMELVERYSCYKYIFNEKFFKICSFKELGDGLFPFEDFYSNYINKHEPAILKDDDLKNAQIRWYCGYSLRGKRVYLPMSMIKGFLHSANGFASGNSLEEALLHGICEIIERHCLTLIEVNKLKTPAIDIATIKYPTAKKIIKSSLALGDRILIKDFSLEIGLPVIGVVRKISKSECIVTCGVATHPEEALTRALTENFQLERDREHIEKNSSVNHYFINKSIISMDGVSNIEDKNMKVELENIEKVLDRQNMAISFLNTTDSELGIPSVIVFISNAKYFRKIQASRNILMILIEESFAIYNYNAAEKYIERAEVVDKKNYLTYLFYKGQLSIGRKDYQDAIKYFQEVLKRGRREAFGMESLSYLCICHLERNEIGKALDCYIKVINLYPHKYVLSEYLISHFNMLLVKIYMKRKSLAKSKLLEDKFNFLKGDLALLKPDILAKSFKDCKKKKKDYWRVFQKAQALFYSGQYKKVISEAKKAIGIAPEEVNAYLLLGACYGRIKRSDRALGVYKEALAFFPFHGFIYLCLATAYFKLKRYAEAIKEANKALELNYKEENIPFLLGLCYEKTKRYRKAIAQLKKAEKIDPKIVEINLSLSNCYRNIGRIEQANKEIDKTFLKSQRF